MAYDFAGLYGELFNRGFTYLNDAGTGLARAKRWINDSAHEIDYLERWPYRMASTTGASPLTIADLGEIESVLDASNQNTLVAATQGELLDSFGDLTTAGTATWFYMVAGAITVYPVSTNTLTVKYWKVSADLSGSTDVPLMPDPFRAAIVERACAKAYRDKDNQAMAAECLAESDRIVDVMREYYELQTGSAHQAVYGYSLDW